MISTETVAPLPVICLHAGARNFAFIHQRAGHAHDFFAIAFEVQGLKLEVAFHARAQRGQAEQSAHELDLVEHGFEKEHTKVGQRRIREIAPAIKIAATSLVGGFEAGVVALAATGQPAGQCPQAVAGDAVADQLRVGLEPDDAAVAVAKRVNPSEPMMGGRDGHQTVGFQNLFVPVKGMETA